MKQVLQNLKNGETYIEEVATPSPSSHELTVQTACTLISTGTEKMLVDFGRAGLIGKIKKQPEKVKAVLDKVKTDGIMATYEAVSSKLNQPIPLGYCNVGKVIHPQGDVKTGTRVVSNGAHAEIVRVSPNLIARIPDNVTDEEAAFTVMGAIALQGIRLSQPTLGETYVVMGLGLIGLLTVQLLIAHGCKVIALDFDQDKLDQAQRYGATSLSPTTSPDIVEAVIASNNGFEVDAVLMTLSTDQDEPLHQAAQMCRKRGRIVLVGVTGLNLLRSDFYEKEISFQVSCSYGPGRYDPLYEDQGQDYPKGFVRWTAGRNMEAFLDSLSRGKITVKDLIGHRFTIDEAPKAYELVSEGSTKGGVILNYPRAAQALSETVIHYNQASHTPSKIRLGVIGAGNYAGRILLPCFKKASVALRGVCSSTGLNAALAAKKFSFAYSTSDTDKLLNDPEINTIVIATNHNTHASLTLKGLKAGKHVFVEKPLALTLDELSQIQQFYETADSTKPQLTVGFNRRFSPFTQEMKRVMDLESSPKFIVMTMNAGHIPASHWTQDPGIGGGRIIGEACHFIDLSRYLIGKKIVTSSITSLPQSHLAVSDVATIVITFEDGSQSTIHYIANGSKSFPKERIEVFSNGKTLQLDNFRKLKSFGWKGARNISKFSQDKGQQQCVNAFCEAISKGQNFTIPVEELFEVARVTLELGHPGVR